MKFIVDDEELKNFVKNNYEDDFAETILEKFDYLRQVFDEQIAIADDTFYEIFDYCVHEAVEAVRVDKS